MFSKILPVFVIGFFLVSCGNNSSTPDYDNSLPVNNIPPPAQIMYKVVSVYPHDSGAFTQGLEYYGGKLYEGTGEYNRSTLRLVDLKTGKVEKSYLNPDKAIFGEGITIFNNKIYQLTWQNNKVYVYPLDFSRPVDSLTWNRQGWGATNDGTNIIISDGSSKLFFVQPDEKNKSFRVNKILTVADNRGEVDSLNELELINGSVFANRWLTNEIVKIDTSTGYVTGMMNLTGLLHQYDPTAKFEDGAVLNGIAYDSATKKMYITGKDWPRLFEIELQ